MRNPPVWVGALLGVSATIDAHRPANQSVLLDPVRRPCLLQFCRCLLWLLARFLRALLKPPRRGLKEFVRLFRSGTLDGSRPCDPQEGYLQKRNVRLHPWWFQLFPENSVLAHRANACWKRRS